MTITSTNFGKNSQASPARSRKASWLLRALLGATVLLLSPACSGKHGGGGGGGSAAPSAPAPSPGSGNKVSVSAAAGSAASGEGGGASGSVLKASAVKSLPLSGQCPVNGSPVSVTAGTLSVSPTCEDGSWQATLDLSSLPDGPLTVGVSMQDAGGNTETASLPFVKLSTPPSLTVTRPANNSYINAATVGSFIESGSCAETQAASAAMTASGSAAPVIIFELSPKAFSSPLEASCVGGSWQVALDLSSEPDGPVKITTALSDPAGNTTSIVQSYTKKVSIPTLSFGSLTPLSGSAGAAGASGAAGSTAALSTLVNTLNEGAFLVGGSCSEDGNPVAVSGAASASTVCSAGAWSLTLGLAGQPDGSILLNANHADSAGNFAPQQSLTLIKDTHLPTLTIVSPTATSFINSQNASAFLVSGSCSENGELVNLSGSVSGQGVCAQGQYSIALDFSSIADGNMLILADLSSANGNQAKEASVSLKKETGGPSITISAPVSGFLINAASVKNVAVSGSCSANGQTVSLFGAASASPTCSQGVFSAALDFSGSPDGNVVLQAQEKDAAGNNSNLVILSLIKEATLPTVFITSPSPASYINQAASSMETFSGACSASGQVVSLSASVGGSLGLVTGSAPCNAGVWSSSLNLASLSDGALTLSAKLTDSWQNQALPATASFLKKTSSPIVSINPPTHAANLLNVQNFPLSGSCSEPLLQVVLSGAVSSRVICSQALTWNTSLNLQNLADGSLTVTANLIDAAGNSAQPATVSFTKSTTPPTLAFLTPSPSALINASEAAALSVSGSCSASGQTVSVSGWGSSVTTTCASGAFSTVLNLSSASDGGITLTADISDQYGNPANEALLAINKKSSLPSVAFLSPASGSYASAASSTALVVSGSCSVNGQTVSLSAANTSGSGLSSPSVSSSATCSLGAFTASLNISSLADGSVVLTAATVDSYGNSSLPTQLTIIKLVSPPAITISAPSPGSYINAASVSSLTIAGSCAVPNQIISIEAGGLSSRSVCSGGVYSEIVNLVSQPEGSLLVTASTSDLAGNIGQVSASYTKLTILPVVSISSPLNNSYINQESSPAFGVSGKCSFEGGSLSLKLRTPKTSASQPDSLLLPVANATCKTQAFSYVFNTAFVNDGEVELAVSETDAAGNTSTEVAVELVKNTVAPTVSISSPLAGSYVNQNNEANFDIYGFCSVEGGEVVLGGSISQLATCASGAFIATLDLSGLVDGPLTITAGLTDTAGNPATTDSLTLIKDSVPPTLAFLTPAAGSYINIYNASGLTVAGSCSDEGMMVLLSGALAASVSCLGGSFATTFDFSSVPDGFVLIEVNTVDIAGNAALPISLSLTKDTRAPSLSLSSSESEINAANAASFPLSGSCSDSGMNILLSGSISLSTPCLGGYWAVKVNLSSLLDGAVTFFASTIDSAGNPSSTLQLNLTKKTSIPTVQILSPQSGSYVGLSSYQALSVTGSCSDVGGAVKLSISGTPYAQGVCLAGGSFSLSVNLTTLLDGVLLLSVTHQDLALNSSQASVISVVKDTITPTLTFLSSSPINVQNLKSYSLSGNCSLAGGSVVFGGFLSGQSAQCSGGSFSLAADFSLAPDGQVDLSATLTDQAGNQAAPAQLSLTKITTPPSVSFAALNPVNIADVSSYTVAGSCSVSGQSVVVGGAISFTTLCSGGSFSFRYDMSALPEGSLTLTADLNDAAGNAAPQAQVSLLKDTLEPSLSVVTPTASSWVNIASVKNFPVHGNCSANNLPVFLSGSIITSVPCSAGVWSTTLDYSALPEGGVTLKADMVDQVGNSAREVLVSFQKDTVAPTLTVATPASTPINKENQSDFLLYGSCSENYQPLIISGAISGEAICNNGSWSLALDFSQLADGPEISLNIETSDLAQNTASVQVSYLKNTVPPSLSFTSPQENSYISISDVSSFAVSGNCSADNQTVIIGGSLSSSAPCVAGVFSLSLDFTSLSDGAAFLTADLTDADGNQATTAVLNLIKLTASPSVTISASSNWINIANVSAYEVDGSCSVAGGTVMFSGALRGSAPCSASGSYRFITSYINVGDGSVLLYADLFDAAGNPAPEASQTFQKDTLQPSVSITSPLGGSYASLSNYQSFPLSGGCSVNGAMVVISGAVSASTTCNSLAWSLTVNLSAVLEGPFTLKADMADQAGNNALEASVFLTKDTVPPSLNLITPTNLSYISLLNQTAVAFSGSCSEADQPVVVSTPGVSSFFLSCSGVAFNQALDLSNLPEGGLTLTLSQRDDAGNSTTTSLTLLKKTSNITISNVVLTADASGGYINTASAGNPNPLIAFSGSNYDYANFVIASPTAACGPSTDFSSSLSALPLNTNVTADGSYKICVKLSDKAGNTPAYGLSPLIIRDTVLPSISSIALSGAAAGGVINSANINSSDALVSVSSVVGVSGASISYLVSLASVNCATQSYTGASHIPPTAQSLAAGGVADGTLKICVALSDAALNPTAYQGSSTFILKASLPTVSFSLPVNNSYLNAADVSLVTVSGSCSEVGQNVILSGAISASLPCVQNTQAAGGFFSSPSPYNLSALADGPLVIYADLTDFYGNIASEAVLNLIKVVAIPSLSFTSYPGYINIANQGGVRVAGSCSAANQLVTLSGAVSATATCTAGSFTLPNLSFVAAPSGPLTVYANMSDIAGNPAPQAVLTMTKNIVQPTVAITSAAPYINSVSEVSGSYTIFGNCSGVELQSVQLTLGTISFSTPCMSSQTFSVQAPSLASLSNGPLLLTADLSDVAGNSASESRLTVTKDDVPPATFAITGPTSLPTGTLTPTVRWGASSDSLSLSYSVSISQNSSCSGVALFSQTGISTTSYTTPTFGQIGSFYACVTAIDAAGNPTAASNNGFHFIVDIPPSPFSSVSVTPATTGYVGDSVSCSAATSDPGGLDSVIYSYSWDSSVDASSWTSTYSTAPSFTIPSSLAHNYLRCTATATNTLGYSTSLTSPAWQVVTTPPTITNLNCGSSSVENNSWSVSYILSSADNDPLSVSVSAVNGQQMTISASSTSLNSASFAASYDWVYTPNGASAQLPVTVSVTDSLGGSVSSTATCNKTLTNVPEPPSLSVSTPANGYFYTLGTYFLDFYGTSTAEPSFTDTQSYSSISNCGAPVSTSNGDEVLCDFTETWTNNYPISYTTASNVTQTPVYCDATAAGSATAFCTPSTTPSSFSTTYTYSSSCYIAGSPQGCDPYTNNAEFIFSSPQPTGNIGVCTSEGCSSYLDWEDVAIFYQQ